MLFGSSGKPPSVVARGGFSGLFPDSSYDAYNIAQVKSVPDVILWCDVQLTKDGAGICFSDLNLENSSTVSRVFPDRKKSYLVNGIPMEGYFPIDFTREDLMNVTCEFEILLLNFCLFHLCLCGTKLKNVAVCFRQ